MNQTAQETAAAMIMKGPKKKLEPLESEPWLVMFWAYAQWILDSPMPMVWPW